MIFILFCVAVLTHSWRHSSPKALDIQESTIWEIIWSTFLWKIHWSDLKLWDIGAWQAHLGSCFLYYFSIFIHSTSLQHFFFHNKSWNKHHTVIQQIKPFNITSQAWTLSLRGLKEPESKLARNRAGSGWARSSKRC